ncbi:MAG: sialyltransferase [Alistipes sp.]
MKNTFRLFLWVFLLAGLGACSDEQTTVGTLSVNNGTTFLSFDGLARSGKISVRASAPWRVTSSASDKWFTLTPNQGPAGETEIEVRLTANEGDARTSLLGFSCHDTFVPFRLSQSAQNVGFNDVDYCFYATFGTLPTLYAGLHLLTHDKPSYVYYSRARTFSPSLFPAHATVLTAEDQAPSATPEDIDKMYAEMTRHIREINRVDPTAVFGLYVDDLRSRLGYDWFVAQGIDSARVKVSLLSDGTGTYNNFYNYFGDAASAKQNWDTYAAEVNALDWNHNGQFPVTRAVTIDSFTWPFYMATQPNYRLVLQHAALLQASSVIDAERAAMHLRDTQPYEILTSLSASAKKQFYQMASFDYDKFAALFDASPKENLIIIGTNPRDADQAQQQRDYVGRILEQHPNEDLFFKPHPADISSADYEQSFPGLTLLPGQMPFEIFVWSLLDRIDQIGGYPSTVFLTVPIDKVGFIFAPNAESLIRPLNLLFAGVETVEWMQ